MSGQHILFIDRDGTLVEEPPDEQVDRLDKVRLLPGVIAALQALKAAGFRFVMVSNQDGLGTPSFPLADFQPVQDFILALFASQGIEFDTVLICPHFARDGCTCRKPGVALITPYLAGHPLDPARSYVIGDRDTDLTLARNLGLTGLRVRAGGGPGEDWPAVTRRILESSRRATLARKTRETDIQVDIDLSHAEGSSIHTGIGFFDHMLEQIARHGGFSLKLACTGDLRVDEHHTVEDCALALGACLHEALGDKRGIGRYGFVLAMDEAEANVALDLSGRPYFVWAGQFGRERVGELPTELVPHFFRSLADSLGAALHIGVKGENTHHMVEACFKGVGRALRQAIRLEGGDVPSTKGSL
ncbi:MAG: bifunctional histidinol-phosphatase/imidazoleglycerol-phosphate dehydratase HisB [Proteobacteria bacterium]|nr:bifunctional histidinol-phosphatase/imidazoleglycerol-phosphate dehydratase HisB [Pseudomonadota bacterium]